MLVALAEAKTAPQERLLLAGKVETMEEYRELYGFLEGAASVLELPSRESKKLETEQQNRANRGVPLT